MEQLSTYSEMLIDFAVLYVPKLLTAIAVLIIGFWLVKRIGRFLQLSLDKANFGKDISPFLVSIADVGLKILILLVAAGIVGIETASLVAVLAASSRQNRH